MVGDDGGEGDVPWILGEAGELLALVGGADEFGSLVRGGFKEGKSTIVKPPAHSEPSPLLVKSDQWGEH